MPATLLTIQTGGHRACMGLSLRGSCTGPDEASQLQQAVQYAIEAGAQVLWIDCRHLEALTWQGQRAMLNADRAARGASLVLQWCGLSDSLAEQLHASGLYPLLHMAPAASYRGPVSVLASPR